jgi:hypothetical protein
MRLPFASIVVGTRFFETSKAPYTVFTRALIFEVVISLRAGCACKAYMVVSR